MRNWQCLVVTAKPATRKWQPKKILKLLFTLSGATLVHYATERRGPS